MEAFLSIKFPSFQITLGCWHMPSHSTPTPLWSQGADLGFSILLREPTVLLGFQTRHFLFSLYKNGIIYLVCMCLCTCRNITWRSEEKLHYLVVSFPFRWVAGQELRSLAAPASTLSTEAPCSPLVWWCCFEIGSSYTALADLGLLVVFLP